jgi:hypothetical protein
VAIVQEPFWTLTVSFQDRDLNKGSVQFYIANTVLIADIITNLNTIIIPRISALSDATVTGWTLNRSAYEDAPALAGEASDVERKGTFNFRAANNRPVTLQIPSFKNTLVVDRTNQIATTDALVAQFIDMVINGVILGVVRPVSVTGSDVTSFVDAYKRHRASSKG